MGIAQSSTGNSTNGWEIIEKSLLNKHSSLEKKIFKEYEELKTLVNENNKNNKNFNKYTSSYIDDNNEFCNNQSECTNNNYKDCNDENNSQFFKMTNIKKQYTRFVKWYKIAFCESLVKLNNKLLLKKYEIDSNNNNLAIKDANNLNSLINNTKIDSNINFYNTVNHVNNKTIINESADRIKSLINNNNNNENNNTFNLSNKESYNNKIDTNNFGSPKSVKYNNLNKNDHSNKLNRNINNCNTDFRKKSLFNSTSRQLKSSFKISNLNKNYLENFNNNNYNTLNNKISSEDIYTNNTTTNKNKKHIKFNNNILNTSENKNISTNTEIKQKSSGIDENNINNNKITDVFLNNENIKRKHNIYSNSDNKFLKKLFTQNSFSNRKIEKYQLKREIEFNIANNQDIEIQNSNDNYYLLNTPLKSSLDNSKDISLHNHKNKTVNFVSLAHNENNYIKPISIFNNTSNSDTKSLTFKRRKDFSKVIYNNIKSFKAANPLKFNEKLSKGPPQSLRWVCWMTAADLPIEKFETNYLSYLHKDVDNATNSQIKKDLNRTLTEEGTFFNDDNNKNSLYKLLKAFAANDSEVNYCQGMNFIAGFLLVIADFNELESFYMMQALFSNSTFCNHLGIRGFYIKGFPLLNFYLDLFDYYFNKYLPKLYHHFTNNLVLSHDSWASKWFLTLFTVCMPLKVSMRIWDCIFATGLNFIIQFSLSLLKSLEHRLLEFSDEFDVIDFFKLMTPFNNTSMIELNLDELLINAINKYKLDNETFLNVKKDFEDKYKIKLNCYQTKYDIRSFESFSICSNYSIMVDYSMNSSNNYSALNNKSDTCIVNGGGSLIYNKVLNKDNIDNSYNKNKQNNYDYNANKTYRSNYSNYNCIGTSFCNETNNILSNNGYNKKLNSTNIKHINDNSLLQNLNSRVSFEFKGNDSCIKYDNNISITDKDAKFNNLFTHNSIGKSPSNISAINNENISNYNSKLIDNNFKLLNNISQLSAKKDEIYNPYNINNKAKSKSIYNFVKKDVTFKSFVYQKDNKKLSFIDNRNNKIFSKCDNINNYNNEINTNKLPNNKNTLDEEDIKDQSNSKGYAINSNNKFDELYCKNQLQNISLSNSYDEVSSDEEGILSSDAIDKKISLYNFGMTKITEDKDKNNNNNNNI